MNSGFLQDTFYINALDGEWCRSTGRDAPPPARSPARPLARSPARDAARELMRN
jgi:hypothetical protein